MHRIYTFILVSTFCLNAEAFEQNVTCLNDISVKVFSKDKTRTFSFFETFNFSNEKTIVAGTLKVTNPSKTPKQFSTRMLEAKFNDAESSRSYVKGVGSYVLDFEGGQEIAPNSTQEINVVWYPNFKAGIKLNSAVFTCS